MARFEELEVWKRAARLSADLYKAFAEVKDFGFRDQITRAGLSIPSNIAEGHERGSNKEIANFLNYAKGSAGELRTQIYGHFYKFDFRHCERSEAIQKPRHINVLSGSPRRFAPRDDNL